MDPVFHRLELALDMTNRLIDPPATSAVRSGLFLSAPRRTGKTTFLREDLVPALESLKRRGLVWRASRGVYSLEEVQLADVMRAEGMID